MPNKSFTGCKKLNLSLFKAIIAYKTKDSPVLHRNKELDDYINT